MVGTKTSETRTSLYAQVTSQVIAELEQGRVPWVQPWDSARCGCTMPHNAGTGRAYSGINVLILWAAVIEGGYASQGWLTYRRAELAGGHVRKGETGTSVCYADRFTPGGCLHGVRGQQPHSARASAAIHPRQGIFQDRWRRLGNG